MEEIDFRVTPKPNAILERNQMGTATQNQRHVSKRGIAARQTPVQIGGFDNQVNSIDKFQSTGYYVAGDNMRMAADSGRTPAMMMVDSKMDLSGLTKKQAELVRAGSLSGLGDSMKLTTALGLVLIYGSTNFIFAEDILDGVRYVIKRPKAVARTVAAVAGVGLLVYG